MNIAECVYIPEKIKEEVIGKFTTTVESIDSDDPGRRFVKVNAEAIAEYADALKKYFREDYSFSDDNTYLWMPSSNILASDSADAESADFKGFNNNFLYVLPYICAEEYFPAFFYDDCPKGQESAQSSNFKIYHASESKTIDSSLMAKILSDEITPEEAYKESD